MSQVDLLLTKYSRRRGKGQELRDGAIGALIDAFMFRRMITPWLIRIAFLLLCVFAAGSTVVAIVLPLVKGGMATRPPNSPSLTSTSTMNTSGPVTSPPSLAPPGDLPGLRLLAPGWLSRVKREWIALVVSVCLVRVLCEGMIVLFQINESLTDVRRRLEHPNAEAS